MVGLDALDPGIARRLAAEGRLPHFADLLDRSTRATVRSPVAVHSSGAWPTIFTGLGVGEHGYHCWIETTLDYEDRWTDVAEDVAGRPFWESLSRAGRRSAVLDVPHSLPDPSHDGVQLIEWGCHDRHHGTGSIPPSFADELTERFGPHPIGCMDPPDLPSFAPCDYAHRSGGYRTVDESRALFDDILIGQARKDALSLSLLSEGGWDLFLTVLGESHCTGHQLWAVHDPEHPWHDPSVAAELGDPVEIIYERLDRTLGRLIAAAGDDATVLVLVPHGMGPHYSGTPLLDQVLHRIEVADSGGPQGGAFTRVAKSLWEALPDRFDNTLRRRIAALLRPRLSRGDTPLDEIPPRRDRRWFRPPSDEPFGPIRLNVIGREADGKIAPGTEFDAACDHLRNDLLDLVNVETGEPAVRDVVRSDTVYTRRPDDTLPDLFVEWNSDRPVEAVYSRRVGLVVQRQTHWRTGDHPADGILLASGPHIAEGVDLPPVDPEDIAPTVCALLGVDLPDATGKAMELTKVSSSR
ncbi:MAG: alkaline phosphatase family protein [Acidimicrobiia bacterium]|nr:alkaline phosphatase family protein [Acidimicrobiia bacterium]